MSILSAWFDRVVSNRGYVKAAGSSGNLLASVLGGGDSGLGVDLLGESPLDEKTAIKSSWVYSNVDTIGKLASESDLTISTQGGDGNYTLTPNHPFVRLFERPNPHMSKSYILRYTSMWLQLRGAAAWLLVPSRGGELSEIWPIPTDRIEPIPDKRKYISGYTYKPEGIAEKEIFLPPEYVCYFREPSVFNYRTGMSKLDALKTAIQTDIHAGDWNLDTFVNDVALRTLISVPSDVSRGLFAQVKAEILQQLIEERRRFIIARAGEIKAESIGLSHKDMEFLAGREFTREEIDRVFGFPAGFWAKEATEANSRSALNVVINFSVWPQLTMISEEITAQILPLYYDSVLRADFTDIRRDNVELKLRENEQRFDSMTINEVRQIQGLEPHDSETYGSVPWPLRSDPRIIALFVPATVIADGTMGIEEIGSALRNPTQSISAEISTRPQDDSGNNDDDTTEDDRAEDNDVTEDNDTQKAAAMTRDWDRYRSIVKRQIKRGNKPDAYEFHSDYIPASELELARFALTFANNPAEAEKALNAYRGGVLYKKATTLANDLKEAIQSHSGAYRGNRITKTQLEEKSKEDAHAAAIAAIIAGYGGEDYPEELIDEIETYDRANEGAAVRLAEVTDRVRSGELEAGIIAGIAALWASRIDFMYHLAMTYRANDPVLQWKTGATVKSCGDCGFLDGETKPASKWREDGLLPQSSALACGGWRCKCELVETK